MFIRFVEFFAFLAASTAAALFYFSPQTHPEWRPVLKYLMWLLAGLLVLSELLVKDFTGKGWEDRVGHFVGNTVCAVVPGFAIPHVMSCYERKIADLGEAIRDDPPNVFNLLARGNLYVGLGDLDPAIKDFSEAIRVRPEMAVAYALRSDAYRRKGNLQRAFSDIQHANKLDPSNSEYPVRTSDIVFEFLRHAPVVPRDQEASIPPPISSGPNVPARDVGSTETRRRRLRRGAHKSRIG